MGRLRRALPSWLASVVLLVALDAAAPALAQLNAVDVAPSQFNATVQVSFPGGIMLPPANPADPAAPASGPVPLRDLLSPGTLPVVAVIPSSFQVTWDPICATVITSPATSPQGRFRLAVSSSGPGVPAGTTGVLLAPGCDSFAGSAPTPETITIPGSVTRAIARRVLSIPVQPPPPGSTTVQFTRNLGFVLTYTRTFFDPSVPAQTASDTVTIRLDTSVSATITPSALPSLSVLERVSGRAPASAIGFDPRRLGGNTVPVTWVAEVRRVSGLGSPVRFESTQLVLGTSTGRVLRRIPGRLAGGPLTEGTATLAESLALTAADLRAAADAGEGTLVATRRFSDGQVTLEASAVVARLTSASGGEFAVTRMELYFCDNNRKVIVVGEGDEVCVEAEINYNGSGQFRGRWLVAGPVTPGGVPFYRTQRIVSEYSFGLRRHVLRLGGIPSPRTGRYLVRLELDEPAVDVVDTPVLSWFAGVPDAGSVAALPDTDLIDIIAPAPADLLVPEQTRLSWRAVPGAAEYRVEIYDALTATGMAALAEDRLQDYPSSLLLDEAPLGGIVVPGDETGVAWSRLADQRLASGGRYWWRVVALDNTGAAMATSPVRVLRRQ